VAGGSAAVSTELVDWSAEEVVGVVLEGVHSACCIGSVVGEVLAIVVGLKILVVGVFLEAWTYLREAEKVSGGAEVGQPCREGVGGGKLCERGSVGGGEWGSFGKKEGWFWQGIADVSVPITCDVSLWRERVLIW